MGTLVYSDLAGAVEDAVDVIAKTRAREAGSLCEANIIVLTDSETVDSSDIADIQAAVGALSTASQVVDPDTADASGQHVVVVLVVLEETSKDPVLEALKCVITGVSVQASPSPNSVDNVLFTIFDYFANAHSGASGGQVVAAVRRCEWLRSHGHGDSKLLR